MTNYISRVEFVSFTEFSLCFALLALMWNRKGLKQFSMLAFFLLTLLINNAVCIPVLFFRPQLHISKMRAYQIFFFTHWPLAVVQAIIEVLLVYSIYSMALAPFEPLKKLGTIIFRWIAAISVAVSLGVAVGPHMLDLSQFAMMVGQLQQTASVLTLCLLLFVCFALKPLGLTYGSRAFGASLGLGILSSTLLVETAWFGQNAAARQLYGQVSFYDGIGTCIALVVWGAYFAKAEPERAMVLLPTTSPYFFWNKISEALGDNPGFVVVSGFTPDSMAPGELAAILEAGKPLPETAEEDGQRMQPVAINR